MVSTVKMSDAAGIENVLDVYKYSSREKLLRVTVWVQRFAHNCIVSVRETARITGSLSVEKISSAEKLWSQTVQSRLKERATFSQLVSQLGLVESEEFLYCKGRLGASDLPLEAKHPILLDNKHHYPSFLIEQCHQKSASYVYNGVRATLPLVPGRAVFHLHPVTPLSLKLNDSNFVQNYFGAGSIFWGKKNRNQIYNDVTMKSSLMSAKNSIL